MGILTQDNLTFLPLHDILPLLSPTPGQTLTFSFDYTLSYLDVLLLLYRIDTLSGTLLVTGLTNPYLLMSADSPVYKPLGRELVNPHFVFASQKLGLP